MLKFGLELKGISGNNRRRGAPAGRPIREGEGEGSPYNSMAASRGDAPTILWQRPEGMPLQFYGWPYNSIGSGPYYSQGPTMELGWPLP